tara:strand:- start:67657 stop:67908 length:252 start_codon:yes stop_codon:yes gene_type:complete
LLVEQIRSMKAYPMDFVLVQLMQVSLRGMDQPVQQRSLQRLESQQEGMRILTESGRADEFGLGFVACRHPGCCRADPLPVMKM